MPALSGDSRVFWTVRLCDACRCFSNKKERNPCAPILKLSLFCHKLDIWPSAVLAYVDFFPIDQTGRQWASAVCTCAHFFCMGERGTKKREDATVSWRTALPRAPAVALSSHLCFFLLVVSHPRTKKRQLPFFLFLLFFHS
ncbi:hypothetical protein TW95_gp1517 [Pandoravirus inopinatum]|uniref:Uncharacterized protein n=1 Tax=Pandoravirus inopinatum TaxID=1605721 RepID=A0A0B5JB79_9VIRU|nr:hypothetical protein TW95_gp1517 [Pandoravirus inopinatum]AJF98251.1 hypothetical protein [Pandoravirus inopinatum]